MINRLMRIMAIKCSILNQAESKEKFM